MKLTPEQAAELRKYLEQLSVKLGALSGEQYADYSKMVYDYVTIRMRNYIAENANTPTSKYQGFTIPEREMQRKQLIRLDWLFENNKFDKDFSYESYGLSSKNAFSIMHKITGTTIIDYVYNSIELICPFLSLLVVFFVVHCIYDDMKNKTILGAVASKHNRWEIILSKLLACTILLVIMLAVFGTLFYIIGGALTGSAAVPPPVLVISGKVAVTNASTIIIVEFLMLLLKLFLIMSFTALLCIFIATLTKRIYSPTTSRVIMYVPACLFAIGEVLLWVFLKQFIEFNAIFLTCAITASCAFVFQTCRIFIKKEYL
jgi:ABC-type transport system involved in multi-copper enzyme maturation permease subunit